MMSLRPPGRLESISTRATMKGNLPSWCRVLCSLKFAQCFSALKMRSFPKRNSTTSYSVSHCYRALSQMVMVWSRASRVFYEQEAA